MKGKLFIKFVSKLNKLGWIQFVDNVVGDDGERCTGFKTGNDEFYIWHINNKILGAERYNENEEDIF